MSFWLAIFGLVTLISSRCFFLDRWKRPQQREPVAKMPGPWPDPQEYEEIEQMVRKLIDISATSPAEADANLAQFHAQYPRPTSSKDQ